MKRLVIAAALAGAVMGAGERGAWGDSAALYKVTEAQLITDFAQDLPTDQRNVSLTVILPEAVKQDVGLSVTLNMREGKWIVEKPVATAPAGEAGTQPIKDADRKILHPAGLVGLFPPLQVGPSAPQPPQKGEVIPGEITLTKDGLKGTVRVHMLPLEPKGAKGKKVYEEMFFDVTLDLKPTGQNLPAVDPDPSTPPWRKNNTRAMGREFKGTFVAKRDGGGEVKGEAVGGMVMTAVKGTFGTEGNAVIGPAPGGGMLLDANLGTRRISGSAAHGGAVKPFEKPLDLSHFDGLRVTVASAERRDDVTVGVGLQEAKGAWYQNDAAGLMLGKEAVFIVPFADLRPAGGFDDDNWLDLDAVKAVRVGVGNPFGVGDVRVQIRKIEAVKWSADGAAAAPTEAVTINVDPTTAVAHEGSSDVPKGLFGFHDVNPPMKVPTAAEETKLLDYTKQVNPGFLRRIEHVGFGGKALTAEEIKAKVEARAKDDAPQGGASFDQRRIAAGNATLMRAHTTNLWAAPPWMGPYAKDDLANWLQGVEAFYQNVGLNEWSIPLVEVWNEPFMWARHINKHDAKFQDATQFSDVPGKLVTDVYSQIFLAAAKGVRAANPNMKVGGPCSAGFPEDHFANLRGFVMPFIDQCHDQIDFITEHHYQGDPASFAASYEVLTAYTDGKWGKRFPIYNTEANDLIDTPNKGDKKEDQPFDEHADDMNRAYYNAKDILTMVRETPDVAKGRAMHALWQGTCNRQGETDVYTLLNNVRGTVVSCAASEAGVRTLATRNEGDLVVFALNDTPFERKLRLPIPVGAGANGTVQTLTYANGTHLETRPATFSGGVSEVTLPKRCMAKWTIPMGTTPPTKTLDQRRFYASSVFQTVRPGAPTSLTVKLPAEAIKAATGAYLRVVTSDVQLGEGIAEVGGQRVTLPVSVANDGWAEIQEIPIDPKILSAETALKWSVARPEEHNGYAVHSAAIVLVVPKLR